MTIDWNPDTRKLRTFGWAGMVVFMIFGTLSAVKCGSFTGVVSMFWPALWLSCALIMASLAALRPASLKSVHLVLCLLTFPIGWTMNLILLCLVYYLVFTPFALFFRLIRRDVLQRRSAPRASYWIERKQERPPESYLRPF